MDTTERKVVIPNGTMDISIEIQAFIKEFIQPFFTVPVKNVSIEEDENGMAVHLFFEQSKTLDTVCTDR